MSTEKLRAEFEDWAEESLGLSIRRNPSGGYISFGVYAAWEAWQASRAAVVVELPRAWQTSVGAMLTPNGVRFSIEAAGLKVKS